MGPNIVSRLSAWILAFLVSYSYSAIAMERINIEVGELHSMIVTGPVTWHLSRRGVVELTQNQEGVWLVVALRAGLVVAKAKSDTGHDLGPYLIQVRRHEKVTSRPGLLGLEPWASWMCQITGVVCDKQMQQLRGEVEDSHVFFQLRNLCRKHQPCIFSLQLSQSARRTVQDSLEFHTGLLDIKIHSDGMIQTNLDCQIWSKARLEDLAKSLSLSLQDWQWNCLDQKASLLLEIKALMIDRQTLQKIQPQVLLDQFTWHNFLNTQQQFLKDQAVSQMIGEPSVQVSIGQAIEIHHGMEIPVISSSDEPREYWRKLGFVLKGQLKSRHEDFVQLSLEFSLSQPGRDRQLTSSHLNTTVWLPIGEERIIGSLDSTSQLTQEHEHLFLASIPIIGPLFRSQQESQGRAQVLLLVKLLEGA